MSFGVGLNEDQLREAMLADAMQGRRRTLKRDGMMADHDRLNIGNAERARARGERTRKSILDQLATGEKRAQDFETDVKLPQVKSILRAMLEEGVVVRRYKRHDGGRIALWALTPKV